MCSSMNARSLDSSSRTRFEYSNTIRLLNNITGVKRPCPLSDCKGGPLLFGKQSERGLLDGALAFYAEVRGNHVSVDVPVHIDYVSLFGIDQHRRMRGGDNAEILLIDKLQEHLQNAPLIRDRECHLRLVQKQDRPVGKTRKRFAEHGKHHLTVTRHPDEFFHLWLVVEEFQVSARVMLFGIEKKHLARLDGFALELVNVAVDWLPTQPIVHRVKQHGFSAAVLPSQQHH